MRKTNILSIVIGIGSYNDLGIIRSCGEMGIPSIYIFHGKELIIPINKSKYIEEFHHIDNLNSISKLFSQISHQYSNFLFYIFPASDSAVQVIDIIHDSLPPRFYAPHAKGRMDVIMDKEKMAEWAKDAGLEVPFTQNINLETDNITSVKLPVILKPVKSIEGEKSDITVCKTISEYKEAICCFRGKGYQQVLVQEYIHSANTQEIGISGIAHFDGTIEIHGIIEKKRNRANINNFGKFIPNVNEELVQALKRYILSCGYVGLFDTDFIFNEGTYYFIECNFRNGAYGYCITKAGFNMPYRWICNSIGQLYKPVKMKSIIFMEERTDVLNVLDGSMPLYRWILDVIRSDTFLWWNWKDPGPMIRIPYSVKKLFHLS